MIAASCQNVLRQNQHFTPGGSFTHRRPGRAPQPTAETTVSSSSSAVERIWSSWRYDKATPKSEGKTTNETTYRPWTLPSETRDVGRTRPSTQVARPVRAGSANCAIRNRTRGGARVEPSRV